MANTFKSDFYRLGTTADTSILNVPASTTSIIKSIYASNINSLATVDFTVTMGATGTTGVYLIKTVSLPIETAFQPVSEPIVLRENDWINAQASSAGDVHIVISYLEIT